MDVWISIHPINRNIALSLLMPLANMTLHTKNVQLQSVGLIVLVMLINWDANIFKMIAIGIVVVLLTLILNQTLVNQYLVHIHV